MLESLILIVIFVVSGTGLLVSAVLLLAGKIRGSRRLVLGGFGALCVPIVLGAFLFLYYGIVLPARDRRIAESFSGTYHALIPGPGGTRSRLALGADGTFVIDDTPYLRFSGTGRWQAGATDGHFAFRDGKGRLRGMAVPFDDHGRKILVFHLYDRERELRFVRDVRP